MKWGFYRSVLISITLETNEYSQTVLMVWCGEWSELSPIHHRLYIKIDQWGNYANVDIFMRFS